MHNGYKGKQLSSLIIPKVFCYINGLLWSLDTGISLNKANHTTITSSIMATHSSESFVLVMFSSGVWYQYSKRS